MSQLSGAVPRIFDGCPSYLSSPQPPSRNPPSKRHINVEQRKEAEQQEWLKCDKIDSYEQFSSDVKEHLQSSFPFLFVHQSENHVLLYKLNHSDDTSRSVSVSLTIRIYKNMSLSVWILTKDTYLSLSHAVTTLVHLIHYLLTDCDMSYVLLGKFQTDNLESRFGNYRQLSGSNYLVSVKEVLQSEKKLKVKSLLNLFSSTKGTITIRDYLINFSDEKKQRCDINFVDSFPYNNISKQNKIDDLSPLLLVSGYVAHKSISHISCEDCKLLFGDKDKPLNLEITAKHLQYFDCLNRGGLTYPSNLLFSVLQCAYIIFNMCISEDFEEIFLKVYNQKYTLIGVIERYITSHDDFGGIFIYCNKCDTEWHLLLIKAIGCFVNVLLNDYSIDKTNQNVGAKVVRKLSKLN